MKDSGDIVHPRRHWLQQALLAIVVVIAITSPWWGRAALATLVFFQVRSVEVRGVRFVAPTEIVTRMGVDTTWSVWHDLSPLEDRVRGHPLVENVRVSRKLPGTVVVHLTERLPVAFVGTPEGLVAYDRDSRPLPIDPSQTPLDLPIIPAADSALLQLLGGLQGSDPALYQRVSEVRRAGRDEIVIQLLNVPVRALAGVTPGRIADILPVEADLWRRGLEAAEFDLRFRDQVITRLQ